MRGSEIAAAGRGLTRPADTVRPDALNVRFRTDDAGNRWVPAAPYLPTYTPGLIYEFPDTSGIHDILTYAALQIACQRGDAERRNYSLNPLTKEQAIRSMGTPRQPDDPGVDPPPRRASREIGPPPRKADEYLALAIMLCLAAGVVGWCLIQSLVAL